MNGRDWPNSREVSMLLVGSVHSAAPGIAAAMMIEFVRAQQLRLRWWVDSRKCGSRHVSGLSITQVPLLARRDGEWQQWSHEGTSDCKPRGLIFIEELSNSGGDEGGFDDA